MASSTIDIEELKRLQEEEENSKDPLGLLTNGRCNIDKKSLCLYIIPCIIIIVVLAVGFILYGNNTILINLSYGAAAVVCLYLLYYVYVIIRYKKWNCK